MAVASAGPYASLHLAPDKITTPAPHHSVFTGRMPFLPPNQQRQSTEGTYLLTYFRRTHGTARHGAPDEPDVDVGAQREVEGWPARRRDAGQHARLADARRQRDVGVERQVHVTVGVRGRRHVLAPSTQMHQHLATTRPQAGPPVAIALPPGKVKVKFYHTRYRALGKELIPVYRQSACR